jgi:hypothetical protein
MSNAANWLSTRFWYLWPFDNMDIDEEGNTVPKWVWLCAKHFQKLQDFHVTKIDELEEVQTIAAEIERERGYVGRTRCLPPARKPN